MLYLDVETCGFHGPCVLIQYAIDDGEVILFNPWHSRIYEVLELLEWFTTHEVCAYNLVFDWFHVQQMYCTAQLLGMKYGMAEMMSDHIDDYAVLEEEARDGPCIKPKSALDLFLHARKTEYQAAMDRKDIAIRRIPVTLAQSLVDVLSKRVVLSDVYFARYKDPKRRWQIHPITDSVGNVIPDFVDIVLKFLPSTSLKALTQDALGKTAIQYGEVDLNIKVAETGYAPFATAPLVLKDGTVAKPRPGRWFGKWPQVLESFIAHWGYNDLAREYAADDIYNLRELREYFENPSAGDVDSILACQVASVRWRGFRIDREAITKLRDVKQKALDSVQLSYNSPKVCTQYLCEVLNATERLAIVRNGKITTKGVVLEELVKWKKAVTCDACYGAGCEKCNAGEVESDEPHPVAERARTLLDARHAKKEIENYNKLLLAGRFHVSNKIIGALSGRMSGADGLNAQGIKREKTIRGCFPLAWPGMQLDGGDFKSFEISIAVAAWPDPKIIEYLKQDRKFHGIFGIYLFPGHTYDEIVATAGLDGEKDLYGRSKNGVFAMMYGGEAYTLSNRVGIPEEDAEAAFAEFSKDFPVLAAERLKVIEPFKAITQEHIGARVDWKEPAEYVESLFGYRRYFTIENQIRKTLYKLAEKPPKEWYTNQTKVVRRDREQTATGATKSALFGAAFSIQGSIMRAAGNHRIQSTGAEITKRLQAEVWTIQPHGVHPWLVMPANFHDELMAPVVSSKSKELAGIVDNFVEGHKQFVPLLGIDWKADLDNWAGK